jgi:Transposase DDE domain
VATDEGAGLVRGVEVTTANVHDAAELEQVLPPEPGNVYADSAFAGGPAERVIIESGGMPRTVRTGIWGRGPEALARLEAHNAAVRQVRCRIEKVFGTWKRSYGLRRMRWLGLAKAGLQVRLTVPSALAPNLTTWCKGRAAPTPLREWRARLWHAGGETDDDGWRAHAGCGGCRGGGSHGVRRSFDRSHVGRIHAHPL